MRETDDDDDEMKQKENGDDDDAVADECIESFRTTLTSVNGLR